MAPRAVVAVFAGLVVFGVSALVFLGVSEDVGRSRPPVALRLVSEADASFPSGHATAAGALGVSVAVIVAAWLVVRSWSRIAVLAAGFVVPALVGLSRLELGVHWPTDVAAGLALGTCSALAVSAFAAWFARFVPSRPTGGTRLNDVVRILGWRRARPTMRIAT